jgi:hypothetical protein
MEHQLTVRDRSRQTIVRYCLKLAVFMTLSLIQATLGFPNMFSTLIGLSVAFCVVLAIHNLELPLAQSLNHWDEACAFGLIFCAL